MEGYRRKPRKDTVQRKVCGVQNRSKRKDRNKGMASAKKKGEREGTLKDLRGVKRRNRSKNVFPRPNRPHENAETAISCWGPGPTRKRKRYVSSREEEEIAQMCPCVKAVESRTHLVGECEICKEERDLLEMRKIDECDMEKFGTLDSSEKTITILGDRW